MNNITLKLNSDKRLPEAITFWNSQPTYICNCNDLITLDTHTDERRVMLLRYVAEELLSSTFLMWEDTQLTRDEIEAHSYMCNDMLELNDGEGYYLDEFIIADYLYCIELYGYTRIVLAVYDKSTDTYTHWLVY